MSDFTARPATIKAALETEREAKCPYARHSSPTHREAWEKQHREIMVRLREMLMGVRS